MASQKISLDNGPNQTWAVSVDINGGISKFFCELNYNELALYWTMDIADQNQVPLLSGIPLVTGLNILAQFGYMEIGSIYILNSSGVASPNYPNDTDLGTDFVMVWADNVSVAEQVA
jgi:hypothetical protein